MGKLVLPCEWGNPSTSISYISSPTSALDAIGTSSKTGIPVIVYAYPEAVYDTGYQYVVYPTLFLNIDNVLMLPTSATQSINVSGTVNNSSRTMVVETRIDGYDGTSDLSFRYIRLNQRSP